MNRITALFLSLFTTLAVISQTPSWQWAHAAGGSDQDRGTAVGTDAAGNVYATGWFTSNAIHFDTITFQNTLTNSSSDSYLVKYTPGGEVLWARHLSGNDHQSAEALATDDAGNVVVAGTFSEELVIGNITITPTTIDANELFVAKYDAAGELLWVEHFGSSGSDGVRDIALDENGNVVVTGFFYGNTFFAGGFSHQNANQVNSRSDLFLVRYDAAGTYDWALTAGGAEDDNGWGVATDAAGNIYLAGFYESGSITIGGQQLLNANDNYNDMILAKYDAAGNGLWAIGAGTIYHERAYGVAVASDGAVYVSGAFEDATFTLGGTELANTTAEDYYDTFLARYDADGVMQWVRSGGGERDDYPHTLAVDPTGGVVIAGSGDSPVASFGATQVSGAGADDLFMVKYDADGVALWAQSAGGSNNDNAASVAVDPWGGVVCTGYFNSDNAMAGSIEMGNAADNEVWVLKLGGITSIPETHVSIEVSVYPVPSAGDLFIQCSDPMIDVSIMDVMGRTVFFDTPRSNTVGMELAEAGTYFARITTENGTVTRSFVIAK